MGITKEKAVEIAIREGKFYKAKGIDLSHVNMPDEIVNNISLENYVFTKK